MKKFLGQLSDY